MFSKIILLTTVSLMSSSVFAELTMRRTEGQQTECEWKYHKDPKSCTRCDNKGLTAAIDVTFFENGEMMQKEYTFYEKPLGLTLEERDSKVVATKVTNPGCLREGIVPGSQLLSVNKRRWGDPSHVFDQRSVVQEIRNAQLPIKISFNCPLTTYSGKYSFVPNGTAHGTWVCYDDRAPTMSDKRRRLCFVFVHHPYGMCWQFKVNYNPQYFCTVRKEPRQDVAPPTNESWMSFKEYSDYFFKDQHSEVS